jgi:gentisate 1,2-dioxygenase
MNSPDRPAAVQPRPDAALIAALESARYHPLWDRYKRITPILPKAPDAPAIWRWRDFEPFVARAAHEVPIEDVERRAIICANPAFGGATVTTSNLIGAFTVLEPGDHAVPHRHTASAIRFATRSEGALTIVNGRRCEMHPGDLVLTPAMCWHGHVNAGDRRTVWFDAANMPLVCALDASFFEPGKGNTDTGEKFWSVDEGDERLYAASGLLPATDPTAERPSHSPKYRYPGTETRAALDALRPAADGSRTLRYTNPLTGGPVMPTLDLFAARLAAGATTRATRSTWNAICLVVSGEGRSTIGGETFEWSQDDVFTVPHWTWATHTAIGGTADLFVVTDRAVFEALDLARTERQ